MDIIKIRERVAELLLPELKKGDRRWFYISIAGNEFFGGIFVKAFGPTDAWTLIHSLNIYPRDANLSTETHEVEDRFMEKVPDTMRWRKLTKEEVKSLQ